MRSVKINLGLIKTKNLPRGRFFVDSSVVRRYKECGDSANKQEVALEESYSDTHFRLVARIRGGDGSTRHRATVVPFPCDTANITYEDAEKFFGLDPLLVDPGKWIRGAHVTSMAAGGSVQAVVKSTKRGGGVIAKKSLRIEVDPEQKTVKVV